MNQDDKLEASEHGRKVDADVWTIRRAIEEERKQNATTSYLGMLFTRDKFSTARRSWTAIFVQFAAQFMVGASFVATYGIQIFQSGGWTGRLPALLAGIGIVTQAVFGLPGAILSDKIGRRPALVGGSFFGSILLMFIGMCGFYVSKYASDDAVLAKKFSTAVIALLLLWCAQFGLTWCKWLRHLCSRQTLTPRL
jgi:MFS family permease